MTLPNVVIIAAPKCGTGSLFAWLTAHPDVCGSSPKEARYLLDREESTFKPHSNYHDHGLEGYRSYFRGCAAASARFIVEATPNYLYQRTALDVLSSFDPRPQIVLNLRRPSERLYSVYQFGRNNRAIIDPSVTFRDFVAMLRLENDDPAKPEYARDKLERTRYAEYLGRWREVFPQIHVFLFERMREDPDAYMHDVATRIGVDPTFYDGYEFPKKNPTVQLRSTRLHRARKALARFKPGRLIPDGPLTRFLRTRFRRSYRSMNTRGLGYQKTDDDRAVLAELDREFESYNARLARDFGLDLSVWE